MPKMNFMPVTEFDNQLRDQYERGSFEYKPANWERLSQQLPIKKKKPFLRRILWLPLTAAAAAVAGFIVTPLFQQKNPDHTVAHRKASIHHTAPSASIINTSSAVVAAPLVVAAPASASVPASTSTASYSAGKPTFAAKQLPNQSGNSSAPVTPIPAAPQIAGNNDVPVLHAEEVKLSSQEPQIVQRAPAPVFNKDASVARRFNASGSLRSMADGPQYDEESKATFKSSSLSIAGGYKYGTANMGYMVGFNGRRSIGKKVFIEGDLAFANSRNSQQTNQTTQENFDQVKLVAGTNTTGARALSRGEQVPNMYYLQLTPTVGYQVLKSMSVGAGADVQRMFSNNNDVLYVMDGSDVKAVPQLDYGVVGKMEYSLTKVFKAGIQYRQGLNNTKDYLNRSYVQVQLKLGILGK